MFYAVLLSVVSVVLGYTAGPPVTTFPSLCTDMIPTGHNGGTSMATDAAPYTITTSASEYTPGATLTVTITGTGGNQFEGFFIQARRADPVRNRDEAIGMFSAEPAETQLLTCHSNTNSAWAHNTNTGRDSVTATWTAPAQDEGPLEFKATIVKGVPDRNYFYLNVKSAQVNTMGAATGGATQPPATHATDQPAGGTTSGAPMHMLSTALVCLAAVLAGVLVIRRN